jgi:hypothetical protein
MAWLGFAVGVVILLATGSSAIKTLLIPRPANPVLTSVVARAIREVFRLATDGINDLNRRERALAAGAPMFLLTLLVTWLVLLVLGFGLLMWPFVRAGLPHALRLAGSSLFTLGFAVPAGAAPTLIVFAAAASGLVVVALLIAYLPVLYAAFNRRETLVNMLEALAGSPPWGPELLARQALIGNIGYLPRVYERWMEWAADISESHANYRSLVYFRSTDPAGSWLLSLLAVLDAAAMHLALCPRSAPPEARAALRVGYMSARAVARSLRLPVPEDPHPDDPIALSRAEFDQGVEWARAAGWVPERDLDEAWRHFRGWRVNYEMAMYQIAYFLNLPPALWSGRRRSALPRPKPPRRPPHRAPGDLRTRDDRPRAGVEPGVEER